MGVQDYRRLCSQPCRSARQVFRDSMRLWALHWRTANEFRLGHFAGLALTQAQFWRDCSQGQGIFPSLLIAP